MVSEYLNQTRSLEQLDALFERDRQAAVEFAEVSFNQEVTAAIRTVTDINEITNARILANAQVASATISSNAEVHAVALLASADTLRQTIQHRASSDNKARVTESSIASELSRVAQTEIKTAANSALRLIHGMSVAAITEVTGNTKETIADIQGVVVEAITQIERHCAIAKKKLSEAQSSERTSADIADAAEQAANKIVLHSTSASQALGAAVSKSMDQKNVVANAALENISKSVESATHRIKDARDKALKRIDEILSIPD